MRSAVTVHEFTHIGQRRENQDRMKVLRSLGGDAFLLLVADGLGGHRGGALAAQTVVETAERCWNARSEDRDAEGFLTDLVRECHAAVNRAGDEPGLDPRSTLVALLRRGAEVTSIHVGDSRVMQFSGTGLARRTLDHSIAQLNVLRGVITEEELATHPDQNKLFTQIGGQDAPEAQVERWDLAEGRWFAVCSDGFWEVFSPDEILAVFASPDPGRELEERFAEKLERLQRHDNTTAILAEVAAPRRNRRWWVIGALLLALLASVLLLNLRAQPLPAAAPRQETEESDPNDRARSTEESRSAEETPPEGIPVPIERVEIEIDREVEPGSTVPETVADALRKAGRIGNQDTLEPAGGTRQMVGKTISRLRQKHKGIRVFAAEVAVIAEGRRIVKIQGHPAPAIDIDPRPAHDYPTSIALAADSTGKRIEALDEGTLVIFRVAGGGYRLAWEGVVLIDLGEERTIFDAETGEILLRVPVVVGSRAAPAGESDESPQ